MTTPNELPEMSASNKKLLDDIQQTKKSWADKLREVQESRKLTKDTTLANPLIKKIEDQNKILKRDISQLIKYNKNMTNNIARLESRIDRIESELNRIKKK